MQELAAQERATAVRLQESYNRLMAPTKAAIARLEAGAQTTEDWARLADLRALEEGMAQNLDEMEWMLLTEGTSLQEGAVRLGMNYAEMSTGVTFGWNTPDPQAIAQLVDYMDRPAMQEVIAQWADYHAEQVVDLALAGVAKGWNPRKIVDSMLAYVNTLPMADLDRMMRTVQIYSYRDATLASWRENSQVVEGWWWRAALDDRTCICCVSMHGTRHTLNESLDDHHRGRCIMVPIVPGRALPEENAGEVWFSEQPLPRQQLIMGVARYTAWEAGEFPFTALNETYQDPIYGQMRAPTPLERLVGEDEAARYSALSRRQ